MKLEERELITTNEIDFRNASYLENGVIREYYSGLNLLVKVKTPIKIYQILSCELVCDLVEKTASILNMADGKWYEIEQTEGVQAIIQEMAVAL